MERERWGPYQLALCSFMHNFMYTECYLKKTTKRLQPSQIMRQKPREFLYLTITSTLTRSRKRPHGFQVLLKKRKKKSGRLNTNVSIVWEFILSVSNHPGNQNNIPPGAPIAIKNQYQISNLFQSILSPIGNRHTHLFPNHQKMSYLPNSTCKTS